MDILVPTVAGGDACVYVSTLQKHRRGLPDVRERPVPPASGSSLSWLLARSRSIITTDYRAIVRSFDLKERDDSELIDYILPRFSYLSYNHRELFALLFCFVMPRPLY